MIPPSGFDLEDNILHLISLHSSFQLAQIPFYSEDQERSKWQSKIQLVENNWWFYHKEISIRILNTSMNNSWNCNGFQETSNDFSVSNNLVVASRNSETKSIGIVVFFGLSFIWAVLRITFIVRIKRSILVQLSFIYLIHKFTLFLAYFATHLTLYIVATT